MDNILTVHLILEIIISYLSKQDIYNLSLVSTNIRNTILDIQKSCDSCKYQKICYNISCDLCEKSLCYETNKYKIMWLLHEDFENIKTLEKYYCDKCKLQCDMCTSNQNIIACSYLSRMDMCGVLCIDCISKKEVGCYDCYNNILNKKASVLCEECKGKSRLFHILLDTMTRLLE